MKPPPLSGAALRAVVAAAESTVTGDVVMDILRGEAGITAMLALPIEPSDEFPTDQYPVRSHPPGGAS